MGYYEFSIEAPDESIEALINMLNDAGCIGVIENERNLLAYFPDSSEIERLADQISSFRAILRDSGLPHAFSFTCIRMPDRDWNETWKNNIQPIDIGESLTIIPPWKEAAAGRVSLIIDPGMAFGTGHHETTRTCLALIEKLSGEISKDRFLDVGTGTGILAISAAKLGFQEIHAVDTDPLAIDAAKRNAVLNKFENIVIAEGTISVSEGIYDIIVSNLVSEILIAIAPDIASRLKENGIAILSGMITGQEDEVIAAMLSEGLTFREKHIDSDRWVSLVLTR
jgi:ribosomal protein L11 methyltransferase